MIFFLCFVLIFSVSAFAADTKVKPAPESKNKKQASSTAVSSSADATGIEMVFVKGGCFQMGEGYVSFPPEKCIDDFYIGKYEVTEGQWKAVMGKNASWLKECGDNCPVENVSWKEVQDFIKKLNQKTGKKYRLPTEAEWEYAARSRGKSQTWAGTSNESEINDYAWYKENSGSDCKHPVGKKKPNGLGIYDMSGNVAEWVSNWYERGSIEGPKNNPAGPDTGTEKVLRGGSWLSDSGYIQTATPSGAEPDKRNSTDGFRLVLPAK